MSETFRVRCPSCSKVLKVPAAARGRKVECSGCGTNFKISSKVPAASSKPPSGKSRPSAKPSERAKQAKPTKQAPRAAPKPASKSRDASPVTGGFFDPDAPADVEHDFEEIDDVEVLDDPPPRAKRKSKRSAPKPPPRKKSNVVEDFEVVDDDYDDYGDDYLDLPAGYEDGPAIPKPRKKKKKTKSRSSRSRRDETDDDDGLDGSIIGGLLCMIAGAVIVYLGFTTETRRPGRAIGFGCILFFSGAGSFIKGIVD